MTGVAQLPPAGTRLDKSRLTGIVDVRARVSDPQSFLGWFKSVPLLTAPHHPYRIGLLLIERPGGRVVLRRTVYIAAHEIPIATGQHYAPGTKQNHPAQAALNRKIPGAGEYWFRLFQKPYWNTMRLKNGRYFLVVRAWDAAGNRARADIEHRHPEPTALSGIRLAGQAVRRTASRARVLLRSADRRHG